MSAEVAECLTCIDAEMLAMSGETGEAIAERLDMLPQSLFQHLSRHQQKGLLSRIVLPADPPKAERWRSALGHPSKRLAGKATRVLDLIAEVERALDDEAGRDALRRREAKLVAELASVRDELRDGPRAAKRTADLVTCPDCGDEVTSGGMGVHRSRSKKHRTA